MSEASDRSLPAGWRVAKIGDVFESWGGHTPSKAEPRYWGEGIPWVSSGDVKGFRLSSTKYTITPEAVAETRLRVCPIGSTVVVVRSGILAHSLPVAVTDVPVAINQDLKAFYSDEPYLNEWLAHFLRASARTLLASSRRDGTTVQSVQYPLLKDTEIPIPPVDQRIQIIRTADAIQAHHASAASNLATARRAIERFRHAVLAEACSGQLTADWREKQETLVRRESSTQEGHFQPVPSFDGSLSHNLPESWKCLPLAEMASSVLGKMLDKHKNRGELKPYLRNLNVRWGTFDLTDL